MSFILSDFYGFRLDFGHFFQLREDIKLTYMYKKLFLQMLRCIFVISHNCMIPGVEQPEVCYKTQRLAALPRQLLGNGTCVSGTVRSLPRGSLTPVGLAG